MITLFIAANCGSIDNVKNLLSNGISVETKDEQEWTALNIGLLLWNNFIEF